MGELSRWMSPHPDWEPGEGWLEDVPVVRYETVDEVVLIDPFMPRVGDFDPHGKRVRAAGLGGRGVSFSPIAPES